MAVSVFGWKKTRWQIMLPLSALIFVSFANAVDAPVQFPPLMVYKLGISGSDTYMSVNAAVSDMMSISNKNYSNYYTCMATLSQRKPAGCAHVDSTGISANPNEGTYNGLPFKTMVNTRTRNDWMDGQGNLTTSYGDGGFSVFLQPICPEESVMKSGVISGWNMKYWCEKNVPMVKKNQVCAGNPINIANGIKQQWETDFSSTDGLQIKRFYAGQRAGWQLMPLPSVGRGPGQNCGGVTDYYKYNAVENLAELDPSLRKLNQVTKPICIGDAERAVDIFFRTPDGLSLDFYDFGAEGFISKQTSARITRLLADGVVGIAWRMNNPDGTIWEFDQSGFLRTSITNNKRVEYTYQNNLLTKMTSPAMGKEVRFEYTNGLITKAITPDGAINYIFGKTGTVLAPGLLQSVVAVDGTEQQYFYEDTRFPLALTGAGIAGKPRYVTWKYDGSGFAIESSHAGGADKFTFDYSKMFSVPSKVTVTNPLLKKTTYEFATIAGRRELTKVTGEPTTNCMGANQLYEYYPNGQIQSQTDWNGNKSYFTYDSQSREATRTEAYGTADAFVVQTCWHPTLNQPSRIIEPTRITLFDYSPTGQLKSQTVKLRPAGVVDCSTAL